MVVVAFPDLKSGKIGLQIFNLQFRDCKSPAFNFQIAPVGKPGRNLKERIVKNI